jgi:hypothetical protein
MARLGFILQSVSIVVVFLAALACASGTTDEGEGASGVGGLTGTGGSATGGTGGQGSGSYDPTQQVTGGTTAAGTGGTTAPVCGNNIKEEGEICDGTDLGGATCDSLASGNIGTLSCASDCLNYDTTMCYPPPDNDAGGMTTTGDGGPSY